MQKFEYKFVRIDLGFVDARSLRPSRDYREVIQQYAADGWRFVQAFSPHLTLFGRPIHYELVFERALEEAGGEADRP